MKNTNVKFYTLAALTVVVVAASVANLNTGAQGLVQTSAAVQIPQALILALNGLLIGLSTVATMWLLKTVGWDLTSLSTPFALSLSTFLVGLAQGWINIQPATSDPWILMALNVLVVVISGLGTFALLSRKS